MSLWEYKIMTSGALGFGSLPLLETHLNQLGKEQWEIISWQTAPGNALIFQGLARRPIQRDWFPETSEMTRRPRQLDPQPAAAVGPAEEPETRGNRDEERSAPTPEPAFEDDDEEDEEDDVPTLFEALKPYLRRNKHGDGWSAGVDFLASKFEQDVEELKQAFVECGLHVPASPDDKPEYVESDGSLYWLNLNQRGQLWINAREKREEKPKPAPQAPRQGNREQGQPQQNRGRSEQEDRSAASREPIVALPVQGDASLLDQLRDMMRRNRRGNGYSGNLSYLARALQQEVPQLLGALTALGLREPAGPGDKPAFIEANGILYWLNKNQGGQVWLNGRPKGRDEETVAAGETAPAGGADEIRMDDTVAAPAPAPEVAPVGDNVLSAVRLLLTAKKTGGGLSGQIDKLADALGRSSDTLMEVLDAAGLRLPETPKGKPTFAELGDEILWLNKNARGQVWLNAKEKPKKKATRAKKKAD